MVRDANNTFTGRGSLHQGEMELFIKTKGTTLDGRGGEVLTSIFKYINIEYEEVQAIKGIWRAGEMGDNLKHLIDMLNCLLTKKTNFKKQRWNLMNELVIFNKESRTEKCQIFMAFLKSFNFFSYGKTRNGIATIKWIFG